MVLCLETPLFSFLDSIGTSSIGLVFSKNQNIAFSLIPHLRGSWLMWYEGNLTVFSLVGSLDREEHTVTFGCSPGPRKCEGHSCIAPHLRDKVL